MKKLLIILYVLANVSFAQYGSKGSGNAVTTAMGFSGSAQTSGIYAVGINPANLIKVPDNRLEFIIPDISSQIGSNFFTFNELNRYFGGVNGKARVLDQNDKDHLIDLLKDGGELNFTGSITYFGIEYKASPTIGAFSFSMTDAIGMNVNLPSFLPQLLFKGNLVNSTYVFDQLRGGASYLRYYTLSYAREIPELLPDIFVHFAGGISVKYVNGFLYGKTERFNSYLHVDSLARISGKSDMLIHTAYSGDFGMSYDFDSVAHGNSSGSFFPSPAGEGVGFDIGFTAMLENSITVSLAVTDIGSIRWHNNVAEYKADAPLFINDFSDPSQLDTLTEHLKPKGKYVDELYSNLPTCLKLGVNYFLDEERNFLPGTLSLNLDYIQGFNDEPFNSLTSRFAFCFEWKPNSWIPSIRSGLSIMGDKIGWALGLGFNFKAIDINISTAEAPSIISTNDAENFSFSVGTRWKIGL